MLQECPLYGTEECRLLNMTRCEECPIEVDEDADGVIDRIAIYQRDTQGVDIPELFSGEECRLCRKTPRKKVGYVIYDLGHVAKNKKETRGWRKILLKNNGPEYDILLPLQLNCCASCRKHLWWDANLVTVTTVGLLLLALIPVSIEISAEHIRSVGRLMPIITLAAAGLIGYFGGKLLRKKLSKKWAEETWMNMSEHPVAKKLFALGWTPVLLNSTGKDAVMFTKKQLDRGLGTAPKAKEAVKEETDAGDAEKAPADTAAEKPEAAANDTPATADAAQEEAPAQSDAPEAETEKKAETAPDPSAESTEA